MTNTSTTEDLKTLEKEAHTLLAEGKNDQAQTIFKKVAFRNKTKGHHRQVALCYASAASCSGQIYGDMSLYASAGLYEEAACEAIKYSDYEYASLLYKYAAINFERDGEFQRFSDCFYESKECKRKELITFLMKRKKKSKDAMVDFFKRCLALFFMTFSYLIWGYGEKPFRTLTTGILMVMISAFLYTHGGLVREGMVFNPSYFDASYFSVTTITTLGYGDIVPMGLSRAVAMVVAFCGIFIMPLFIVGLSRKYLRI